MTGVKTKAKQSSQLSKPFFSSSKKSENRGKSRSYERGLSPLGPVKPDMKLIHRPVLKKIDGINNPIQTSVGRRNVKAKLLAAVFDLPAKAMVLSTTQFNGKHGCANCLDEGIHISHRRLYLPSDAHKRFY